MTTGHLDTVRLAEHAEGLLKPTDADAVTAHLEVCPQCRRTAAALESVTARLAAAPQALPTPPVVAARLDRALAAEHEAATEATAPVVQLGWFRRRAPKLVMAAAAVSLFGLVGYAITTSPSADDSAMEEAITADAPATLDEEPEHDEAVEADEDAAQLESAPERAGEAEDGAAAPFSDDAQDSAGAPDELDAAIREVVDRARAGAAPEAADGCGRPLADSLGLALIGSVPTGMAGDDAVLVVVEEEPSVVQGWVLPGCDAGPADVLVGPRLVTIE